MINKIAFITVLLAMIIFSCSPENEQSTEMIDSLRSQVTTLQQVNDSLKQSLQETSQVPGEGWFNPQVDGRKFLQQGIDKPEQYIKEALEKQPELINMDPVLGGTMHFVKIKVLSENWLIAQYEDGHVMGKALFSYELQKDGTIQFQLIDSKGGE